MGKFHESIVVVAVVCVVFGPMCMQCSRDFWASMGKFHESIAAVAVICVVLWYLHFGRPYISHFRCRDGSMGLKDNHGPLNGP